MKKGYIRTEKIGKLEAEVYGHRDCGLCQITIIPGTIITHKSIHPDCKVHNNGSD